jgi:flagellar hook assembly protein FlgD
MSANQTITVMVASTHPTVTGGNVSVKKGHKATFMFNVTAVTPTTQVIIQIRTKSGRTVSTHHYMNVTANADMTRSFKVNMKKGKYNIRIGAVDLAGNTQTQRGGGTLTVK